LLTASHPGYVEASYGQKNRMTPAPY
jgi:hypothetical protein